ncbi:MAG: hypothetical protein JW750_01130 [Anaerolineaceae bacterium]|nr:hypothetical protein [Anaerolineaceae bacterium]
MNPSDMNIQILSRTVLRNAQIEAKKILAEAEEKVNEIKQQAAAEREMEYRQFIDAARQDSNLIKNKNIASAQAEAQMRWLVQREELINQVFDESLKQLPRIADQDDYAEIVTSLIREAVFQLNDPQAQICLDAKADQLVGDEQISQIAAESGVSITRGEPLAKGTGAVAMTLDRHRQFDNTLEARLRRQQGSLRLTVYKILVGEDA